MYSMPPETQTCVPTGSASPMRIMARATARSQQGVPMHAVLGTIAVVLATFVLVGCGGSRPPEGDLPKGGIADEIALRSDGWTYFLLHPPGQSDRPAQLWRTKPGHEPAKVTDIHGGGCEHPYLSHLATLPDERLGLV